MSLILPPWYGQGATPGLWGAAAGGDPYFSSVVLLALNDNAADGTTTFVDQSTSAKTLTAVGNVQYDTAQAPTGMTSSGLFDGTNDAVTAADSDDWNFGNGDWTVEAMVRFNGDPGTTIQGFFGQVDNATGAGAWEFLLDNNKLEFYYTTNGLLGTAHRAQGAWNPADATWYHVEADRNGADLYLFVDGSQVGSTFNASTDTIFNTTKSLTIGNGVDLVSDFNGWHGNIRITKGVARHTADFTPPTLPLPTS